MKTITPRIITVMSQPGSPLLSPPEEEVVVVVVVRALQLEVLA